MRAKNQGGKRSHFHVNSSLLVLPFLLFLMLHEAQFCGFVELTCVRRTSKNVVSPRDQKRSLKNNCRNSILMTCHSPGSGKCFRLVVLREKIASTNRKHYPDLGSNMSSVRNFCSRFSDVILVASGNVGFFLRLNLNLEMTNYGGYALKLVSRLLVVPAERSSAASRCFSNDLCYN